MTSPRFAGVAIALFAFFGLIGVQAWRQQKANAQPVDGDPRESSFVSPPLASTTVPSFFPQPPPASRAFESWSLRETLTDTLARIGSASVPEMRRWLSDPNPEIRRAAADLIGRIGPDAAEAIPDLIILLDDENAEVRKHAARALGQIGSGAAEATPALTRILREEILKEQTREEAAREP